MNPFTFTANLLTIRKEIPPIHFSYIEPFIHNLPKEISDASTPEGDGYFVASFVGLENLSGFVLKKIRIKLRSPLKYHPQLRSSSPSERIDHAFDKEKNEITVESLDPGQSIYLDLYPEPDELVADFEPTIIINDQLLTRTMKEYGYFKKHPKYAGLSILLYLILAGTVASTYYAWKSINIGSVINGDRELVDNAVKRLGEGCYVRAVRMGEDAQRLIYASPETMEYSIKLNGAESLSELLKMKKIVLCVPKGYVDEPN